MIVDTHTHVFTNDRMTYPQFADTPRAGTIPSISDIGQEPWPETTAEKLIAQMDAAGVDKATLVQAYFVYEYDNRYTVDSANAYPDRFVSICALDPAAPESPDKLSNLVENAGVKGIRFMRGRLPKCTLGDPETHALWKRIAELKIPLCIHDKVEELPRVRALLERYPEINVAFDHGWGHKVGEPPYPMIKALFDLAIFPNAYVKTAINNIVAAREGVGTPQIFYTKLIESFGAHRIMWSSNYPAHPHFGSIASRLEVAKKALAFLSSDEQAWIFGRTALRVWPWLAG
ncbi:amidohydrolase family protein [Phyllobacterium sp. SB3]|uniref:amidohydrolase family protein n=1 Tax=Phyllobacterium sp. SB3 TaxID=3156073 RepID=UPI0032AEEEF9